MEEVQEVEVQGEKVGNCVPKLAERALEQSPLSGWPKAEA